MDSTVITTIAQINNTSKSDSIHVLVRVRPLSQSELIENQDSVVNVVDQQSLSISSGDGKKTFKCSFDHVLGPNSSQADVYQIVKNCTESVVDGFNSTIFAYGQTGSGKTYSMYGPPVHAPNHVSNINRFNSRSNNEVIGLIPRAINEIFEIAIHRSIIDFQIHCSFVQIYNENLYDMLRDPSMNNPLSIREDQKEIYVQGLSEYNVKSVADTMQLLKIAEDNRAIRETHMNMFSSRSHSIFQIILEHKKITDDDGKCISALAQISLKQNRDEIKIQKGLVNQHHLNSLMVGSLGIESNSLDLSESNSISSLTKTLKSTNNTHVPYRESKLTRLLQDSLGGNAKTYLIATISPARINSEESISTLKFADRAKQVMVQAVINETRPVDYVLVKRLQQEIEMLKSLVKRLVTSAAAANTVGSSSNMIDNQNIVNQISNNNMNLNNSSTSSHTPSKSTDFLKTPGLINPGVSYHHNSPSSGINNHHHNPNVFLNNNTTTSNNNTNSNEQINITTSSSSSNIETSLEYVISLEKALNQEQIHSQHLLKKNETLIKELEELKFQNMQYELNYNIKTNNNNNNNNNNMIHNDNTSEINRTNNMLLNSPHKKSLTIVNKLSIDEAQTQQIIQSVQALIEENKFIWDKIDFIQNIMKKFFKFQIEEDDMRIQLDELFKSLKQTRSKAISNNVNDNFAFLELLINHNSTTSNSSNNNSNNSITAATNSINTNNNYYINNNINANTQSLHINDNKNITHSLKSVSKPKIIVPITTTTTTTTTQQQLYTSSQLQMYDLELHSSSKSKLPPVQYPLVANISSTTSTTNISTNNITTTTSTTNNINNNSSYMNNNSSYNMNNLGNTLLSDGYIPNRSLTDSPRNLLSHNKNTSFENNPLVITSSMNKATSQENILLSYRLKGSSLSNTNHHLNSNDYLNNGNSNNNNGNGNHLSNISNSNNSLKSSNGWVLPTMEEAEIAEENLKKELKRAKKKLKKQQQMEEWQRIKDEKIKADIEAEENERKAQQEAEIAKEKKRQEYAQKQKLKLAKYQDKVKSEAEKIQELKNLGIDPNSLF